MSANLGQGFDIPYVCNLYNHYRLCETLPLFTFQHPNNDGSANNNFYNNRITSLKFKRDNFFIGILSILL
jgi:hypothetical protein